MVPDSTVLTIRPASFLDLDGLVTLMKACVQDMLDAGIHQWDDIYPTREVLQGDVQTAGLLVAHHRDMAETAGCVVVNTYQDPEYADVPWTLEDAPIGVVHRVMTHPRARGRGVARALMDAAENHARARGFKTLRLDAFDANPRAVRLYQGLGYRHAGFVQLRKGRFWVFEKRL